MISATSSLFRWVGALILVGLVVLSDVFFTPAFALQPSVPLLLLAVGLTGWLFGFWPSLLALFLSVLVLVRVQDFIPQGGTLVFVLTGIGLVALVESQRRVRRRWREKDALAAKLLSEYEAELLERKRAQAAEQRHSLRLEVTLSSIADGLVATDETGVVTYINPVAQKMLGVDRSEAEGVNEQTIIRFVDEDSGEALPSPIRMVLGLEPPANDDAPRKRSIVNKWGESIPVFVNASVMKDSQGDVRGAVLVLHDLTHVRESELRTAEIAKQYAELNEVVPVPVWTSDVNSQRTYVNSKWLDLTGRTLEETLGVGWLDAVHPDDVASYTKAYTRAVESRTKMEAEYRLLAADGTHRWILERGVPRYSALGEYIGYIGSCVDITNRKSEEDVMRRSEERLRSINGELERLNAELAAQNKLIQLGSEKKMRFLATMSHELRTPMNSILGFLQLLSEDAAGPLNEKQKRYIARIQNGGQHLLKVVEQVLDFSKIDAGRLQLDWQHFEVGPVIEEIVAGVVQIDNEKRLNVSIQAEPQLVVWADPHRFRQIMYNLMSNAAKFTPDQGQVIVAGKRNGSFVRFSVTDTGPGIEPALASAVFEEFFQADSPMTESRGTGLGLAITRRLVEAHGGRIKVETAVGKGSSFIFSLPASAEASASVGETRAS